MAEPDLHVSIRDYFDSRFTAFNARLDAYVNQHREMHEKLAEQVLQASQTIDHRLKEMNELRTQITSERGNFVTRDMLDQRNIANATRFEDLIKRVDQRIDEQANRISDMERMKANLDGRISMLTAVLTGFTILINLAFNFLSRSH